MLNVKCNQAWHHSFSWVFSFLLVLSICAVAPLPTRVPLLLHFHFLVLLTNLLVLMDQNAYLSLTFAMDINMMASRSFAMTDHTPQPLYVMIVLQATYSGVLEMGWILV